MKNFLKENWFKISIIVVILIVIGGVFYWFEWRPSQIRKNCIKQYPNAFYDGGGLISKTDEAGHKRCLAEHGLEK